MRFYLVDQVTCLKPGEIAEGIKCVTKSEDFLEQHFPGYPVMPGVLILESMAQLSGYLFSKTKESKGEYVFAILSIVEKAKFYNMACPGDQIKIVSKIDREREESGSVHAKAFVNGKKIAEARMMFVFFPVEGENDLDKKAILKSKFVGLETPPSPFTRGQGYV